MLYWNLERELVEGEPLFFGQNKQFQYPTQPPSTTSKIYSETSSKKVSSAKYQRKDI
jgi:hypothetical protein